MYIILLKRRYQFYCTRRDYGKVSVFSCVTVKMCSKKYTLFPGKMFHIIIRIRQKNFFFNFLKVNIYEKFEDSYERGNLKMTDNSHTEKDK
jgi:hypothetical protein